MDKNKNLFKRIHDIFRRWRRNAEGIFDGQALLIGVHDYQHPPFSIQPFKHNVKEIAYALSKNGGYSQDSVVLITGGAATKDRIKAAFSLYQDQIDSETKLLIFISGYAINCQQNGVSSNYFIPCDGDINDLSDTAIIGSELVAWLAKITSKNIILLLDTSHQNNKEVFPDGYQSGFSADFIRKLATNQNLVVLTSAEAKNKLSDFARRIESILSGRDYFTDDGRLRILDVMAVTLESDRSQDINSPVHISTDRLTSNFSIANTRAHLHFTEKIILNLLIIALLSVLFYTQILSLLPGLLQIISLPDWLSLSLCRPAILQVIGVFTLLIVFLQFVWLLIKKIFAKSFYEDIQFSWGSLSLKLRITSLLDDFSLVTNWLSGFVVVLVGVLIVYFVFMASSPLAKIDEKQPEILGFTVGSNDLVRQSIEIPRDSFIEIQPIVSVLGRLDCSWEAQNGKIPQDMITTCKIEYYPPESLSVDIINLEVATVCHQYRNERSLQIRVLP
jgi:hypothetical protein